MTDSGDPMLAFIIIALPILAALLMRDASRRRPPRHSLPRCAQSPAPHDSAPLD